MTGCIISRPIVAIPIVAISYMLTLAGLSSVLGCTDLSKLAATPPLPAGIPDPSVYHTAAGALDLYQNALLYFNGAQGQTTKLQRPGVFLVAIEASGALTDELQASDFGQTGLNVTTEAVNAFDSRNLPSDLEQGQETIYDVMQTLRGTANEGIGALQTYDDTASPALRAQLFALQGYSEIFLADLFCSGIPLSTLDFNGDYTYHTGSTTSQVYSDAVAKFDTALTLSSDSIHILNLARVGRGRAWLALGNFDSAAASVAHVPNGFHYDVFIDWNKSLLNGEDVLGAASCGVDAGIAFGCLTVSDQEGHTGLPYRSNGDPRDSVQQTRVSTFGQPLYAPLKYGGAALGIYPTTLADWIEVRLITAEAAWHNPARWGNWLAILNELRQTGITPALPALTDPGTPAAQVRLIFQERAYWLFLTGHRQGDLRRLIRQYGSKYGFSAATVYPTGAYPLGGPIPSYGQDVNLPIPSTERSNPLFTGCLSRGA